MCIGNWATKDAANDAAGEKRNMLMIYFHAEIKYSTAIFRRSSVAQPSNTVPAKRPADAVSGTLYIDDDDDESL
ncbi:BQ2448_5019 [Microbotryum intermedium]|uniref:BQ2448_5019 protein n=1 Tax=Microbotryum intermedium TaxID=269621 RepID=A0A238F8B3_9BASI|nr:BQ2448_5019 [Microbotryum intermedium]